MKHPVTETALKRRINRKLAKEGLRMFRCRADRECREDLGEFYLAEIESHEVTFKHFAPEAYAREHNLLKSGEAMVL